MSDLRSRIVRLAHARPELRPHLLPLVEGSKQAASGVPSVAVDLLVGYLRALKLESAGVELGLLDVVRPGLRANKSLIDVALFNPDGTSPWVIAFSLSGKYVFAHHIVDGGGPADRSVRLEMDPAQDKALLVRLMSVG